MPIWTETLLSQFWGDAGDAILDDVPCLFYRFFLNTVAGTSVYTLPELCKSIIRVTWRGIKLEPMGWDDFIMLAPATAYADPTDMIETVQGRPYYYVLHPTNIHDIKFYPTPDETFTDQTADVNSPTTDAHCIISCWREEDDTSPLSSIPPYIDRRTRKAYAAWRAFEKEGKGQNLTAAKYYKQKFQFLIGMFRKINEGCFVSKHHILQSDLEIQGLNLAKPILPPNFERVRYR